jgi:hypothetical protein
MSRSYVDDAVFPYLRFELDIPGSFGLRRIRRQFRFFKWFFSTERPSRRRWQRNRQQQPCRHQLRSVCAVPALPAGQHVDACCRSGGQLFFCWAGQGACSGVGVCKITLSQEFFRYCYLQRFASAGCDSDRHGHRAASAAIHPVSTAGRHAALALIQGTAVTLTAAAAEGSTFVGWAGGCTGTDTDLHRERSVRASR